MAGEIPSKDASGFCRFQPTQTRKMHSKGSNRQLQMMQRWPNQKPIRASGRRGLFGASRTMVRLAMAAAICT
jgi:hypothetical protein